MHNAYVEVARTYLKRPLASWTGGIWTLITLILVIVSLVNPLESAIVTLRLVLLTIIFGGVMLWGHFREHVVSERRRLWPGFVAPQVQIFTAIVALLVIGWPLALTLRGGVPSLGTMACAASCMAWLGWSISALPWMLPVGAVLFCFLIMSQDASRWVTPLLVGGYEPLAIAMLVAALFAIGLAASRMIRMTEEDANYGVQTQFGGRSLRPRVTGEMNAAWREVERQKLFIWPGRRAPLVIPGGTSLWARARRWRGASRGMLWFGAYIALAGTVIIRLISSVSSSSHHSNPMLMIMATALPLLIAGSWLDRWRFLESESLLPIDRRSFLKELGLAIGIDLFQAWAGFTAVIVVDLLIFGPHPIEIGLSGAMLFASLMLHTLGFAMVVWMMRYRSPVWLTAGYVVTLLIPGMALNIAGEEPFEHRLLVICLGAVAIAALGVAIVRDAYRRWRVTELG